jgi:hypothetical protein
VSWKLCGDSSHKHYLIRLTLSLAATVATFFAATARQSPRRFCNWALTTPSASATNATPNYALRTVSQCTLVFVCSESFTLIPMHASFHLHSRRSRHAALDAAAERAPPPQHSTLPRPSSTATSPLLVIDSDAGPSASSSNAADDQRSRLSSASTASRPKRASVFEALFGTAPAAPRHLFFIHSTDRVLQLCADSHERRLEWMNALKHAASASKRAAAAAAAALALAGDANAPPIEAEPARDEWEIDYALLTIREKVGDGAFGEVFRGRLWGTDVAIKKLKDLHADVLDDLKREIAILSTLRHPNMVLYIGACTKPPNVCIVTEWCDRGSLNAALHGVDAFLSTRMLLQQAMGIAQGMNYLHSLGNRIIHRDLKSHNILLDKNYGVKIADFGLSHMRDKVAGGAGGGEANRASIGGGNGGAAAAAAAPLESSRGRFGIYGTPYVVWILPSADLILVAVSVFGSRLYCSSSSSFQIRSFVCCLGPYFYSHFSLKLVRVFVDQPISRSIPRLLRAHPASGWHPKSWRICPTMRRSTSTRMALCSANCSRDNTRLPTPTIRPAIRCVFCLCFLALFARACRYSDHCFFESV